MPSLRSKDEYNLFQFPRVEELFEKSITKIWKRIRFFECVPGNDYFLLRWNVSLCTGSDLNLNRY